MPGFLRYAGALVAVIAASTADAQYPSKPIRMVVPFPPGGGVDSAARVIVPPLSQALGQPIVIENRPGADGAIAADAVIKSPPDGYTLYFGSNTSLLGISVLRKNPPYDSREAFTPVSMIGRIVLVLAVPLSTPAKTFAEFIAYVRANPGKVNYGTGNMTSTLATTQLMKLADIQMVLVPYKGDGPASIDLVAGRLDAGLLAAAPVVGHAKEGKLRLLAVLSGQRSPAAPDLPTLAELVPGISIYAWVALFGPAKIPRDIVERLAREMNATLTRAEVRELLGRQMFEPEPSTPEALASFLRSQLGIWSRTATEAGIQPE